MAAYISFGVDASSLLTASVMAAPAALAFSKLVYPETQVSRTAAKDIKRMNHKYAGFTKFSILCTIVTYSLKNTI